MKILRINLHNYRNYDTAAVEFGGGINLLLGDNAQGKTNLLEAVYLTSIGRSARTPRDRELIRWGCDRAIVRVHLQRRVGTDTVEIALDHRENKRIAINSLPIVRIGELMGVCNSVLFSPDEMRVVKQGPAERRRFVDIAICQMSRPYFYALSVFNRCLAQRNKLLRQRQVSDDVLDVWDEQLAEAGSRIVKNRRGFVQRLGAAAAEHHSWLTDGAEQLVLAYEGLEGDTHDQIKQAYLQALARTRQTDIRNAFTSAGAQKDDFRIMAGDVDLRSFGSQGQQRTAALSLKLGEMQIMSQMTGEAPVLLLDDVLSELDPSRCAKLLQRIRPFQTIITATHLDPQYAQLVGSDVRTFRICGGQIQCT